MPEAPRCRPGEITNHTSGHYCDICNRMKMPWEGFLPIARYQGLPVSIGRPGTILQAVQVDSPREIGMVAFATWAINNNQWDKAVQIDSGIERGRVKAAAHALTDISYMATQKPKWRKANLGNWWNILHEALLDPELTMADYKARIRGEAALTRSKTKSKSSRPIVLPDVEDQEQRNENLGYDDIDNIPEGKKLLFFSRDRTDDNDLEGDDDEEYEDGALGSKIKLEKFRWQFAPGQDLEPAYLASPDTSKFFMVRQLRKDPNKIDVREYPHIAGFDWNDKEAVKGLNRGRNQIILRTNGPKAPARLAWSQMERDLLRYQVIKGLKHGVSPLTLAEAYSALSYIKSPLTVQLQYTKNNMPWDQVAHNINVDLEKVTQRQGSALARPSKWNPKTKQQDFHTKRHLKMQKGRTGSERNATGCMNQSNKFGDIDALLRNSVEQPNRRKTLNEMLKIIHDADHLLPLPKAISAPCVAQDDEMQTEDGRGSSGDETSSTQSDRMQRDGVDDYSDDEPLMKRRKSVLVANNLLGSEPPMTRRKSENVQ
ncbi:f728fbdf-8655-4661-8c51-adae4d58a9ec [Sclerotinia trifoliorum]|uniref:F728fbdf-8655-4661-8c51-adae4d58a9ec n=1 Tax=Sclerotinia trifoliorum TaxID=28548 RepID=A0A8H2VRG0_9HELO|nr:f728fbdf-8655-4661-8c51-adae4d58a9ec [Sclerotinia trifoliorum]